ncbi:MAG TPA: DoxX family protein [Bacteroidia bacterium]|jgi:hypothetical protein|nr:DoxX family protein [Bacteroidia bacterium]
MEQQSRTPKAALWTGYILKTLFSLFLLFDAAMKVIRHPQAVEGTKKLGLPEECIPVLGIYLLIATVLFIIPRTAILGALFITAYLGGAVAITYQAKMEGHPYVFAIVFAVLLWISEYLRSEKLRQVFPLVK